MNFVSNLLNQINGVLIQMDQTQWAVVSVIVLGIGVFCMRGFGTNARL